MSCDHFVDGRCTQLLFDGTPTARQCAACNRYSGPDRGLGDKLHRVTLTSPAGMVVDLLGGEWAKPNTTTARGRELLLDTQTNTRDYVTRSVSEALGPAAVATLITSDLVPAYQPAHDAEVARKDAEVAVKDAIQDIAEDLGIDAPRDGQAQRDVLGPSGQKLGTAIVLDGNRVRMHIDIPPNVARAVMLLLSGQ